ncbi:MAG TPA: lysophospholipid acyltransferase family protein [Candidatus Gastranaerophilaceae bacterium]|nr:lysophospholipid acyltransferase family protein [Candidatus Gastranaerophilaceae bacterium]HPT41064.1 lysophospholipid acyltransferase family protein [Candidatus Gastranaerophilaceae bacterium]
MREKADKDEAVKKYMTRTVENYNCWRRIWQWLVTKFWYGLSYRFIYRLEVYGQENIPKTNDYIVVGNHLSTLDPPLVCHVLPHPVAYMGKKELFYHPFLKVMLDWLGTFAVDREKVGLSTIKTAKSIRNTKKWVLGLFPQGTREKGNEIRKVTKGFVGLAKATGCNILPIGITGTDKPTKIPFTGKIIVRIGPIIELSDDTDDMFNKWIKAIEELTGFTYVPEEV